MPEGQRQVGRVVPPHKLQPPCSGLDLSGIDESSAAVSDTSNSGMLNSSSGESADVDV